MIEPYEEILPPAGDEVEITLMGPAHAFGECILIHSGEDHWTIIDCCINPETGIPLPIEYLEFLYGKGNTECYKYIKQIIVTHWDNDHIRGISKLYNLASCAEISLSPILKEREILRLIRRSKPQIGSRLSEINGLYNDIVERGTKHSKLNWLYSGLKLFESPNREVSIQVLSPSNRAVLKNYMALAKIISKARHQDQKLEILVGEVTPNMSSSAVILRVGEENIILGADLEFHRTDKTLGWDEVLDGEILNGVAARIYKVSHHGSETAYTQTMWDRLFPLQPFHAILTPWKLFDGILPTNDMIETITNHTAESYITANPYNTKDEGISDGIQEKAYVYPKKCGIISLRKTLKSEVTWAVKYYGSALRLSEINTL